MLRPRRACQCAEERTPLDAVFRVFLKMEAFIALVKDV